MINFVVSRRWFNQLSTIVLALTIAGCGGGSSSAGSGSAPMTSSIPAGYYGGPQITVFSGPDVDETPIQGFFELSVSGNLIGQQQVIVIYRQFSGSSSILPPNNFFSIRSGPFIVDTDFFGRCEVDVTIAGNFSGVTVVGTTDGTWTCVNASGLIFENSTWTLTHGDLGKAPIKTELEPRPLNSL